MRKSILLTAIGTGIFVCTLLSAATPIETVHCQVPCGIYGDYSRITSMLEDTTTIAKAIKQINELSEKDDPQSFNQATRWVINKESHAQKIQDTIAEYFLAQRVKAAPVGSDAYGAYLKKLAEHHAVIVAAMKAKQTVDPKAAETLSNAIKAISAYYPEHKH